MTTEPIARTPGTTSLRLLLRSLRRGTRRLRNILLWFYLAVRNVVVRKTITGSTPIVVSITTYGRRIDAAAMAIESIARGSSKPSRIILWLDDPEIHASRPPALRRLEARGLEILLTDNLGPHTKYFPYVQSTQDHRFPLVTADDDIMYPVHWLRRLQLAYLDHPTSINCHWASRIMFADGNVRSYHTWPNCSDTRADFSNIALGVSGVIYPPAMLRELAGRGTAFLELSPTADDIWLHWVALRAGYPVRQISPTPRHFALIPGTQEKALMKSNNVEGSGNDAWIRGLYSASDRLKIRGLAPVAPASAVSDAHGLSQDLVPAPTGHRPYLPVGPMLD
ncbi:hypothetical protein ACX80O_14670 [Arthrobacter sp. Hz1]